MRRGNSSPSGAGSGGANSSDDIFNTLFGN
jgi:hypothetical protein